MYINTIAWNKLIDEQTPAPRPALSVSYISINDDYIQLQDVYQSNQDKYLPPQCPNHHQKHHKWAAAAYIYITNNVWYISIHKGYQSNSTFFGFGDELFEVPGLFFPLPGLPLCSFKSLCSFRVENGASNFCLVFFFDFYSTCIDIYKKNNIKYYISRASYLRTLTLFLAHTIHLNIYIHNIKTL